MDDSPSNRYHSEGPNNGTIVNLDSEATGIMVVDRPDLEGADSREKRGRGKGREVGGFIIATEGKVKGEEEDDSVSSDSSEEDEEVDEHRLLSASFHAKAAAAVRGGAGGGGKSTGIAVAQSDHNMEDVILFLIQQQVVPLLVEPISLILGMTMILIHSPTALL